MTHNELSQCFHKLLPDELVSPYALEHWHWLPTDAPDTQDARIGIGNCFRVSAFRSPVDTRPHRMQDGHFQLVTCCCGDLRILLGGTELQLQPGSMLLISPKQLRSARAFTDADTAVILSIREDLLQQNIQELPAISSWLASLEQPGHVGWLQFQVSEQSPALWYLRQLCCEHFDPDHRTYLAVTHLFHLLLLSLDRTIDTEVTGYQKATSQTVAAVCRYVRTNCNDVTLEKTARRFGFSPNYLSALLKKNTGMSFQALKQSECLLRAEQIMQDSSLSIAEAAAAVGIHNLTHFYRLFQKKHGMTPSAWRKQFGSSVPDDD